jgi:hypothetical protein
MGEKPLFGLSVLAGADLSAKRYHAVKLNAAGAAVLAGAGESSVGILQVPDEAGKCVNVMQLGISFAVLGAPVANAGVNLTPDAAGKLVTAAGADAVIGFTLTAGGTTGDIVPICLVTRTSSGTTGIAKAYNTVAIPVTLSVADNCDLVTDYVPGFAGKIVGMQFVTQVVASTAGKTADISLEIEAVAVTGGALALTTAKCDTVGKVAAATAITGTNTITAASKISVLAGNTATPFVEGSGTLYITFEI